MIRIKFRAWNKLDNPRKKFILKEIDCELWFVMENDEEINYSFSAVYLDDDWILEQYTGHEDKNGVEICEGDVLGFTNKWEWYKGSFPNWYNFTREEKIKWVNEQPIYKVNVESIFDIYDIGENELSSWYEVIGNIHEEEL